MANPAVASSTFGRAIEIFNTELTKDGSKRIDTLRQPVATFDQVLSLATSAKQGWHLREWKVGQIAIRDKVYGLLTRISTYAVVGDGIMQQCPLFVNLAWGAFRSLLIVGHYDRNKDKSL